MRVIKCRIIVTVLCCSIGSVNVIGISCSSSSFNKILILDSYVVMDYSEPKI